MSKCDFNKVALQLIFRTPFYKNASEWLDSLAIISEVILCLLLLMNIIYFVIKQIVILVKIKLIFFVIRNSHGKFILKKTAHSVT